MAVPVRWMRILLVAAVAVASLCATAGAAFEAAPAAGALALPGPPDACTERIRRNIKWGVATAAYQVRRGPRCSHEPTGSRTQLGALASGCIPRIFAGSPHHPFHGRSRVRGT